jgi:hypothetical protein
VKKDVLYKQTVIRMVYTESITEMIKCNTQNCINEFQDIKRTTELPLERAGNIIPEDTPTANNDNEIKAKIDSLVEKIENWDPNDDLFELARCFNELRELKGDDDIDAYCPSGDCFHMDLYHRIDSIFPLITCEIDGNVLYRNDDGKYIVESIESLSKKHLTLEDKRAVAHLVVNQMAWDEQLDKVLKATV